MLFESNLHIDLWTNNDCTCIVSSMNKSLNVFENLKSLLADVHKQY